MTRIKVATDITVLGNRFDTPDPRHGIYNVIEGVLKEICERDDIDLTAVGLSGNDPLASSIRAWLYLEQMKPPLACSFRHTFSISPGLTEVYLSVFRRTLSGALPQTLSRSARQAALRAARSVLYRLTYAYGVFPLKRTFDYKSFDVFHCPHINLPEREVTGDLPRVITIYDLIPVVNPDFVKPEVAGLFKRKLAEIDLPADWIVCISDFTRQEFCEYTGMSPDRCLVTPLAADPSFRPIKDPEVIASTRVRYGIPEGQYFLSLAAPQPRKNLVRLILSFFQLLEDRKLSDTYLVLAGSKEQGWMYDEIFAAVDSSLEHRSHVVFTGYVTDEDLPALYSDSLAFVFPSLYEGFGLPLLEAMACGTAVITSNTTSLPEVAGDAGLMVDPMSSDDLSGAMLTLAEDNLLRLELGQKGLMRAAEFSWKRCTDETAKAYHFAAAESRTKVA